MTFEEILSWLRESDPQRLEALWRRADDVRRKHVGDDVYLRGLVEVSNHCVRRCGYCGLRGPNGLIARYRMTADEILACAHKAMALGYGTMVLQSGEDPQLSGPWVADVIRRVRDETPLAVTLSLGERDAEDLRLWRRAGADRYLLRFETSNRTLFDRIHPPHADNPCDRVALLGMLKEIGFETGSGVMIGIPGQTHEDVARDIELFAELDLDMIGVGPYLTHPETPLADAEHAPDDQAPATELMTYKVIALARIACPATNIPATTALATLNKANGRELGLMRGANIVMPNLTPVRYRALYEIYPDKACVNETAEACQGCLAGRIQAIGRRIGRGRGDSVNYQSRADIPVCH